MRQLGSHVVAGLVLLSSVQPLVFAEAQRGPGSYTTPLVVPAAAFVSDGEEPSGYRFHDNGHLSGTDTVVHLGAPVYLPQGARIRAIEAYVYDNTDFCGSGGQDVDLLLWRVHQGAGGADLVGASNTFGSVPGVQLVPTSWLETAFGAICITD